MGVDVKVKLPKPSKKPYKVSAIDIDGVRDALDSKDAWGSYDPAPVFVPKFAKDKSVSQITVSCKPVARQPSWAEYGKTTKKRQAEWDRMIKALEKYLTALHNLALESAAKFAAKMQARKEPLQKDELKALFKEAKEAMLAAVEGYASKTSNGYSVGVKLDDVPPDPAVFKKTIPKPKDVSYSVSGKTIEAVFKALNKRSFWGRYRSNASYSASFQLDGHVKEFKLTSKPVVTMPKWKEYSKGNKGQKGSWDTMWKKLYAHENNHHKIFTDCVAALETSLASENVLKADLKSFWETETKEWQKKQDAYDSKTDHGVKEGVELDASHDP